MQIKTLKLDLKVVVRETGSVQGDIYSTFQEEQVIDGTQCMSVRLSVIFSRGSCGADVSSQALVLSTFLCA